MSISRSSVILAILFPFLAMIALTVLQFPAPSIKLTRSPMAGAAGSVMVSSAPLVAVSIKIISFALAVSDDVAVLVAPPPDVATGKP